MIEKNILEWLEVSDSIQKLDVYNNNYVFIYKANYLFSRYSHFSQSFYLFLYLLFFAQIWELNLLKIEVKGDLILEIIKYLEKILLIPQNVKPVLRIIFIILATIGFSSVWFITFLNLYLLKRKKKIEFLLSLNVVIYFLNIYFINGPVIQMSNNWSQKNIRNYFHISLYFNGYNLCINSNILCKRYRLY